MCFHVSSKISCFSTCIIALCALVWRLFTVGEYVTFQVSSSTKRTSIFCTFVYLLPSLGDHVHPQRACFTKCLHTFWASVSFHSTVGEHVRFQMCSLTKWLVALDTSVCLLFAVGCHVHLRFPPLTLLSYNVVTCCVSSSSCVVSYNMHVTSNEVTTPDEQVGYCYPWSNKNIREDNTTRDVWILSSQWQYWMLMSISSAD